MKKFLSEFCVAMAVHAACLLWFFHGPLLRGQVDSLQAKDVAAPAAITDISEMSYEIAPALAVQSRQLKGGIFPSWSPLSQGGTPLIAKMQNAVFAPYHIPLYITPGSWMPYVLTLIIVLKYSLAFAFAYLYARSLGLGLLGGILAGTAYVASKPIMPGTLFAWPGAAIYLPLLLLLVELHFRGFRRLALLLWPWAAALPFLSGYFEGAVRLNCAAAAYFLAHLWAAEGLTLGGKLRRLLAWAGASAAGAGLAAIQILPAKEYVDLSFNKVWHSVGWLGWGWQYETVSKHLSPADSALLAAGFAGLALGAAALRWALAAGGWTRRLARATASAALIAAGVACLANLGLDDSAAALNFGADPHGALGWLLGLFLLFLSLWEFSRDDGPRGRKILGWLLLASLVIVLKTPLIGNILIHLPLFKDFHNTARSCEYWLPLAILGAAALERARALARKDALGAARGAFLALCVLAAGFLASQPLKQALVGRIDTGTSRDPSASQAGGFMGPEQDTVPRRTHWVAGWTSSSPPIASVRIVKAPGGEELPVIESSVSPRGARAYFRSRLRFPATLPDGSVATIGALVRRTDGSEQLLVGPRLLLSGPRFGESRSSEYWLLACTLAFPLALLLSPRLLRVLAAALLVALCLQNESGGIAPSRFPYPLPGISAVKADPAPLRIASLEKTFLQADYANLYGLADLRIGGDNLDILPMVHFYSLWSTLAGEFDRSAVFRGGLGLLGLANVKYLVDRPDLPWVSPPPGLEPFYRGGDMLVFKNSLFRPRAGFYPRASVIAFEPIKDWSDADLRARFREPYRDLLVRGFDWSDTLVLNDPPSSRPPDSGPSPRGGTSSVAIEEDLPNKVVLAVDAARAGFVLLADNAYPGWEAFVDGRPARILRSWITFRAVEVPAGRSRVVFDYRPRGLWLCVLLAVLISIVWLAFYRRHKLAAGPLPVHGKAKRAAPAAEDLTLDYCASAAEALCVGVVGAGLAFWLFWSAFLYAGDFPVNAAGRTLLAGGLAVLGRDLWRLRAAKTTSASDKPR